MNNTKKDEDKTKNKKEDNFYFPRNVRHKGNTLFRYFSQNYYGISHWFRTNELFLRNILQNGG